MADKPQPAPVIGKDELRTEEIMQFIAQTDFVAVDMPPSLRPERPPAAQALRPPPAPLPVIGPIAKSRPSIAAELMPPTRHELPSHHAWQDFQFEE